MGGWGVVPTLPARALEGVPRGSWSLHSIGDKCFSVPGLVIRPSCSRFSADGTLSQIDRMTQEISDKTMTTIIECGVADYLHPITDVFGTSHDYAEIQVLLGHVVLCGHRTGPGFGQYP